MARTIGLWDGAMFLPPDKCLIVALTMSPPSGVDTVIQACAGPETTAIITTKTEIIRGFLVMFSSLSLASSVKSRHLDEPGNSVSLQYLTLPHPNWMIGPHKK